MENRATSQPSPPVQQGRLGSVSQGSIYRSNSLTPDDGYNYQDAGPSPEGSSTKEREDAKRQNANDPSRHKGGLAGLNILDETEEPLDDEVSKIYERPGGGIRVQLPDQPNLTNRFPIQVNDHDKCSNVASPLDLKSRSRRHQIASTSFGPETLNKPKFRHVMLQWEKERENVDEVQRLILKARVPGEHAKVQSPNHVTRQ